MRGRVPHGLSNSLSRRDVAPWRVQASSTFPVVLDLRQIRTDPDGVRAGLARRGADLDLLDRVLELDEQSRALGARRDELRNQVKTISKEIGGLFKEGRREEAEARKAESKALGDQEKELAGEAEEADAAIREALLRIPNLPSTDAPA